MEGKPQSDKAPTLPNHRRPDPAAVAKMKKTRRREIQRLLKEMIATKAVGVPADILLFLPEAEMWAFLVHLDLAHESPTPLFRATARQLNLAREAVEASTAATTRTPQQHAARVAAVNLRHTAEGCTAIIQRADVAGLTQAQLATVKDLYLHTLYWAHVWFVVAGQPYDAMACLETCAAAFVRRYRCHRYCIYFAINYLHLVLRDCMYSRRIRPVIRIITTYRATVARFKYSPEAELPDAHKAHVIAVIKYARLRVHDLHRRAQQGAWPADMGFPVPETREYSDVDDEADPAAPAAAPAAPAPGEQARKRLASLIRARALHRYALKKKQYAFRYTGIRRAASGRLPPRHYRMIMKRRLQLHLQGLRRKRLMAAAAAAAKAKNAAKKV